MSEPHVDDVGNNVNVRLARIEQILPTLATKNDLKNVPTKDDPKGFAMKDDLKAFATKDDLKAFATKDDLKVFPTKDDLQTALKSYATKDDLKAFATKDDLKAFPTKDDLQTALKSYATKQDLVELRDELMTFMKVLIEDLRSTVQMLAEAVASGSVETLMRFAGVRRDHDALERRVTIIEARTSGPEGP